ncbi:LacI family DNA-binding transcriptional regulator [Paenibacillus xerothermodurans]|uniref:LacI family transcriptional regulator n=1 Tax=Paenibacillus xerothermodurans TaxID=1977292 RepID=A0A2W1P3B2_PAEXE|nr:LacI family DNA-binding transcriptional regulator [Paenibacillus xerothermodurans]PZE21658.1 LacI family transcriptional regulator [Paenibacillus xerothermodurans]
MRATIYDVAREAGVSIAAVSQVLNGKGKISEERRNEIFRVMAKLNFQPSVIAAALTGKKTYTLGLLVPDISNPFFAEIARAVEDQVHGLGYSLMICSTDNKDDRLERYLTLLQQKSVDAVIIGTGIQDTQMLAPLLSKGMPTAMIARETPNMDVTTVVANDFAGGAAAARHLLALGHTHIAVVAERSRVRSSLERIRGVRHTLVEAGLSLPDDLVKYSGDALIKDGKYKAMELLQCEEAPTAIFCCNDLLAIGALQAAKDLSIRVPEDLSIVGFDNTILAAVADPPLTTVAQPTDVMCKTVVELLMQQLKHQSPVNRRIVLEPELVARQSTSAPRASNTGHQTT